MIILGSRSQMCIHPEISKLVGTRQNEACLSLVSNQKCGFHRNLGGVSLCQCDGVMVTSLRVVTRGQVVMVTVVTVMTSRANSDGSVVTGCQVVTATSSNSGDGDSGDMW